MSRINDIEAIVRSFASRGVSAYERGERMGDVALPEPRAMQTPDRAFNAVLTGVDAVWRARRLETLAKSVGFVQIADDADLAGLSDHALGVLQGPRVAKDSPSFVTVGGAFFVVGGLDRFRGQLTVSVRTVPNVWEEPGRTRVVLPAGSTAPSDAYEDAGQFVVATPSAIPATTNWGDQDAEYEANEVARGFVAWDWRPDWYTNQVRVFLDPAGVNRRAEIEDLSSSTKRVRVLHRKGYCELQPDLGRVVLSDDGATRTLTVADFSRWGLVSWRADRAVFNLGGGLHVDVHANRLVRFRGAGTRLAFVDGVSDVSSPSAFSAPLGGAWRIAATTTYAVASGAVTVNDGGDVAVVNDSEEQCRILMKDVWLRLGVRQG